MDTTGPPTPLAFGFGLEKWYADVFLEDGSILIVTIGRLVVLGVAFDRLSADLYRPNGSSVSVAGRLGRGRWAGATLQYRHAVMATDSLSWKLPGVAGSLAFRPRYPPCAGRDPLLCQGSRGLRWIVDHPDSDVVGALTTREGRVEVRGRGYRDYVALDLPPWTLRGWELRWGRSVGPGEARVWLRLATPMSTLEFSWCNGIGGTAFIPPGLAKERVLADSIITALPIMRVGPLRRLLGRIAGEPRQLRIAADVVDGSPGRAIHESVTWGAA